MTRHTTSYPWRSFRSRAGTHVLRSGRTAAPAPVNGATGVVTVAGRPFAVMGFSVAEGKIVELDAIADPERIRKIAAAVLTNE
jgi:hypothetical protein